MKSNFYVTITSIFCFFVGGLSAKADDAKGELKIDSLLKTSWSLVSISTEKGEGVLPDQHGMTLEINEKGEISGKACVNRYFGSVSVVNGKLSWSPIGSTRMAGSPERMAAESLFMRSLPLTTTYEIVNDVVTFSDVTAKTKMVLKAVAK